MTLLHIEKPFLLFVEGDDEEAVVGMVLMHLGLDKVQLINAGGKAGIRARVAAASKLEGFDEGVIGLGIMRDADLDPAAAWQSCKDSLRGIQKRTQTFLSPQGDNITPGILEDICLRVLGDRPEMDCVNRYVECVGALGLSVNRESKFRVLMLLTTHDARECRHVKWAVAQGWLDPAHAAFGPLREFLLDFTRA